MSRLSWPRSSRLRSLVRASALASTLALALGLILVVSASAQLTGQFTQGSILLGDHSLCWFNNQFFGKTVYPSVTQYYSDGSLLGNGVVSELGWYVINFFPAPTTPGTKLVATCEGATVEHIVTQADINNGRIDLVLPNSKPVVTEFIARLNGQPIRGVPPGSTVTVAVTASDPDGDAIHYQWKATDGAATSTDTPAATWVLPSSPGLHFLYVLISDGKGGYAEKQLAISTDGGVAPAIGTYRYFLPSLLPPSSSNVLPVSPSQHVPANSHFLNFPGRGLQLDDQASACAYYHDIGAVTSCAADGQPNGYTSNYASFAAWKLYWGFGATANEASALYANLADLNLQRDMHTLSRPAAGGGTDVASYVCNYPNPVWDTTLSNVRLGNRMVACVAFEYSVTNDPSTGLPYNGGLPFTKFLTFGPAGSLLLSVNLDGRGEKYEPGACVACHGGAGYFGHYGQFGATTPALGSQFIPYDLDNYQFSTVTGFRQQDQEAQLRALNQFVLATGPYTPTVELINGWYPTPASNFTGSFVPPAWQGTADGRENLYRAVVKPDCRMCHLTLPVNRRLAFESVPTFALWNSTIASHVCGSWTLGTNSWYTMPNAKQTFDRFWTSAGSPQGLDAPTILLQFLMARGTTDYFGNPVTNCTLPSWQP